MSKQILWISSDNQDTAELLRLLHRQLLDGEEHVFIGVKGLSGLEQASDMIRLATELLGLKFWDVTYGRQKTSNNNDVPVVIWEYEKTGSFSQQVQ